MGRHYSPQEKLDLINEFYALPYASYVNFAREHHIAENTFRSWVKRYEEGGFDALLRKESPKLPDNQQFSESIESYKQAYLKLRVDYELLKILNSRSMQSWGRGADSYKKGAYQVILGLSKDYDTVQLCKILKVSRSGYYKWLKRESWEDDL